MILAVPAPTGPARRLRQGDLLNRPAVTRLLSRRPFGECGQHHIGVSIGGKDYDVDRYTGRRHRDQQRAR